MYAAERKNNTVNHPPKSEDTSGKTDSYKLLILYLFVTDYSDFGNFNAFIYILYFGVLLGKNAKGKVINLQKRDGAYKGTKRIEWSKFCCCLNYLKLFAFLYRKDIPEACFYNTLNLSKTKKEESSRVVGNVANKADSGAHGGNKVLPITEDATETKDQTKGDKKKPISNMKDLNRWAASAKTEKGGKLNGRKVNLTSQPLQ